MIRQFACLAALLFLASPARAGIVTLDFSNDIDLTFKAHAGEANAVTVVFALPPPGSTSGGEATFIDTGAPLDAVGHCRSLNAHAAVCAHPGGALPRFSLFRLDLGDGADTVRIAGEIPVAEFWGLHGGAGADFISIEEFSGSNSIEPVILFGEDGDDQVVGSAFGDVFHPGAGNDLVRTGTTNEEESDIVYEGFGDDRIEGRGREDIVSYARAPRRIDANLATGRVAGWGNDHLSSVERLLGSSFADSLRAHLHGSALNGHRGSDLIVGGPGSDFLGGDGGNDRLRGQGGRDHLFDFSGVDRLDGGRGADYLDAGPGGDLLNGGAGRDRLEAGSGNDILYSRDRTPDSVDGQGGRDCAIFDRRLDRLLGIELRGCLSRRG
jgi:Ca2+-binding RTX toxin-like protein